MSVLHQNSGVIGNPSPLPLRFPSTSRNLLGLGKSLGHGDRFPNISLLLMEDGPNPEELEVDQLHEVVTVDELL